MEDTVEKCVEAGADVAAPEPVGDPVEPQPWASDAPDPPPEPEVPVNNPSPKPEVRDKEERAETSPTVNGSLSEHSEPEKSVVKRKKKANSAASEDVPPKKSKKAPAKAEPKVKKPKAKTEKIVKGAKAKTTKSDQDGIEPMASDTVSDSHLNDTDTLVVNTENHVKEDIDKISNASLSPTAAFIPNLSEGRQRRTKSPKPGDFARKPRMRSPNSKSNDKSSPSDDDLPLAQLQSNLAASEISSDSLAKKKLDFDSCETSTNAEADAPQPKKKKVAKKAAAETSVGEENKEKKKKKPSKKSEVVQEESSEIAQTSKPAKKKSVKSSKAAAKEPSESTQPAIDAVTNTVEGASVPNHVSASSLASEGKKTKKSAKSVTKEGFEADIVQGNKIDSAPKPLLSDSTPVKLLPASLVKSTQDEVKKSIDIYDMIDEDFDDLPIRPSGGSIEKLGGSSPRAVRLSKEKSEEGRCEKCGLILPTAAKLTKHVEQCEEGKASSSEQGGTEEKPFKCSVCDYKFKWRFKLRRHQQTHGIYECPHCDLQAKSVNDLEQHLKETHPDKPGNKICKTCKSYIVWGEDFDEHVKNCHGKEPLKCQTCGKEFKSRSKLKAHEPVHNKPKTQGAHQCPQCEYSCNDKSRLNRHLKNVHGQKIICPTCNEEFANNLLLSKHIKTQHGASHVCEVCQKEFTCLKNLNAHKVIHNPPDLFKCTVEDCPKSFKSLRLLREHTSDTHNNVKKWQCTFDGCTQEFLKRSHLKRHEATHTGERKFKCDWPDCGKAFRHADNLKVHYRQHTNEKPFKCAQCDFACRQKSSLQWHLRRYHQLGLEGSDKSKSGASDQESPSEDTLSSTPETTPEKSDKGSPVKVTPEKKPKKKPTKAKAKKTPAKGANKETDEAPKEANESKPKLKKKETKKATKAKEPKAASKGKETKAKKTKSKKVAAAKAVEEKVEEEENIEEDAKKEEEIEANVSVESSQPEEPPKMPEEVPAAPQEEFKHDTKVLESPVSEEEQAVSQVAPLRPQESPTQEGYQSSNEEISPLPEADERPHAPRPISPVESPSEHNGPSTQQSEDEEEDDRASTRSLADDDYIAPSAPAPPQPIEDPGITPPPEDSEPETEPQAPEPDYYPTPQTQTDEHPPTPIKDPASVAHSVSSMMSPSAPPKSNSVPSPPPMYTERPEVNEKNSYSPQMAEVSERRESYQSDYPVPTPQSHSGENSHPPPEEHVYREPMPSPGRPLYSSSQDLVGLPPPPTMSRDSGYSSSMMSTPGQYLQPPLPAASEYPRTMSCMPLPNRSQDASLFPPPPTGNFYNFLPPESSLPPVDGYGSTSQRQPTTLPQEQQPSSFHMLSRPNTDLFRRDIHKGYGTELLQAGMHQTLPQSHWDDRRHWTQPSSLTLPPPDISSKESFLSVEREYENRQLNKTAPTFPADPMSHLDMASMYMGRHFNPAAAAAAAATQNYQRQLPTTANPAKSYEDTYRSMPDYRALSQTGGDMFRSMSMTGFGLEKYYYPRDPMYRPQHLPSSSNPFMAQPATNQMNPYADRDYARNPMYQPPYFMGDKQYLDSRKLTQPPMALTNRPLGADYFTGAPPPNASQDPHFQDPYRRSVIYNMMNRYFD